MSDEKILRLGVALDKRLEKLENKFSRIQMKSTMAERLKELEQKIDHGFGVIRDFNNIQKKKTLTLSAVLEKFFLLGSNKETLICTDYIESLRDLRKLDGSNWNPTLGDGIPMDARFDATDGGEPSNTWTPEKWEIYQKELKEGRKEYQTVFLKEEQESYHSIPDPNDMKVAFELHAEKEEQEYVTHIDPITHVKVQLKKEAEPHKIKYSEATLNAAIDHAMDLTIAEFIKDLRLVKGTLKGIPKSLFIIIEKWEAKLKDRETEV